MNFIKLIKKIIKQNLMTLILASSLILIGVSLPTIFQDTENSNFKYEE